jgi:hypothetical protein
VTVDDILQATDNLNASELDRLFDRFLCLNS